MNLTQAQFLLSESAAEYLRAVYRQSKPCGSVQINFVAARLHILPSAAAHTAAQLHALGLVRYEKYGRLTLTEAGLAYCRTLAAQSAKQK